MKHFSDETFVIDDYDFDIDTGVLSLHYQLGEHRFKEVYTIPIEGAAWSQVNESELTAAIFALHLICGVSYWKTTCAKRIEVRSGDLTPEAAAYWNHLYTVGMGEYHYKNQIDFRGEAPFEATVDVYPEPQDPSDLSDDILVPMGGGKDSVVTAELLKAGGHRLTTFASQDSPPIKETSAIAGGERLIVDRAFDLSVKNVKSAFNGHVPISAIWAHLSVIVALLHHKRDVVFSWEASASEGNLEYLGMQVNHQYSKSLDFERRLGAFLHRFVTRRVRVFSVLRPWTEFRIMKSFASLTEYHSVFTSCNRNFTQAAIKAGGGSFWCHTCPKCAFVFALLAGFLPHARVVEIVGEDLFANEHLLDLYRELLGIAGNKPFECVGEAKEVVAALEEVYNRGEALETPLMQLYVGEVRDTVENLDTLASELLTLRKEHAVPDDYLAIAQTDLW